VKTSQENLGAGMFRKSYSAAWQPGLWPCCALPVPNIDRSRFLSPDRGVMGMIEAPISSYILLYLPFVVKGNIFLDCKVHSQISAS